MRISDHRYNRDLRRHNLALRLIAYEARTQTICNWTGLSDERVRNLCQSYTSEHSHQQTARHRGPSPRKLAYFLRSSRMQSEAAALAGLCRLLGVIPLQRLSNVRRELPSLSRGERLCTVFEMYRRFMPDSEVTLEHAVLLVTALAQGTELEMGNCVHCGGVIVVDRYGTTRRACIHCHHHPDQLIDNEQATQQHIAPADPQQDLF
jgi:hypothetical protein